MTTQEEHDEDFRQRKAPICDTCKHACVWSEFIGWVHSTPDHHYGDPRAFADHEVTAREWLKEHS